MKFASTYNTTSQNFILQKTFFYAAHISRPPNSNASESPGSKSGRKFLMIDKVEKQKLEVPPPEETDG